MFRDGHTDQRTTGPMGGQGQLLRTLRVKPGFRKISSGFLDRFQSKMKVILAEGKLFFDHALNILLY